MVKMKVLTISFKEPLLLLVVMCCLLDNTVCLDCKSKVTCDQCIQELNCFWCTVVPVVNFIKSHCIPRTNLSLSECAETNTEDPKQEYKIRENRPLTESEQMSPQKVKLKLRKNEKFEINFSYKQSDNYPVDLYYLMDVSNSMAPSKQQLADLGKDLAAEMRRKTNNFKIGFGSFVDKLTLPYVNTHPKALEHPCEGCAAPYSYKNHLSLQPDANLFSRRVKETQLSGNLDTPEGGLDAIMQAMVCHDEIGWRQNARHLLVMSTDAVSHIAGDGKLGGVIEPNDAKCHMENNTYTQGLVYDYPSVSHINYVARQNNINLIFAIVTKSKDPEHLTNHYRAMSSVIENSKTGTLDVKSNNVVQFISDIYDQIRESVRITSDATKDVSVTINSTCSSFINGGCINVTLGETLNFTAIIEPLLCHKDAALNKKTITIKPEGLRDSLVIDLEVSCDCGCAADRTIADPTCDTNGTLECGSCICNTGFFGINCKCDEKTNQTTDQTGCMKTCSKRGRCICGECRCQTSDYSGPNCECYSKCPPANCFGHGDCKCGICVCHKGWTGNQCDCPTDKSQCYAPGSEKECFGNGHCKCNECVCKDDKKNYKAPYCEIPAPKKSCNDLKPCVESNLFGTGIYANDVDYKENCKNYTITKVEDLKENLEDGTTRCRMTINENNCDFRFEFFGLNDEKYMVMVVEKQICPTPVPYLEWIAGVIAAVLLIGIITLITWKVITTVHDKNEYAKFISERNQTTFGGENPLYKPGTSHFQNPAYMRASQRFSVMNAARKTEKVPEATSSSEVK